MRGGRNKKSLSERELCGNPSGRKLARIRLRKDFPDDNRLSAKPPFGLSNEGRAFYAEVRRLAYWLTPEDAHFVRSMCLKFDRVEKIRRGIAVWEKSSDDEREAGGMLIETGTGYKLNPLLAELRFVESALDKQLDDIGLTPRARVALNLSRGIVDAQVVNTGDDIEDYR